MLFLNGFNIETNLKRTHYYYTKQKLKNEEHAFCMGFLSKDKRNENFISHSEFLSFLLIKLNQWLNFKTINQDEMIAKFDSLCLESLVRCNITKVEGGLLGEIEKPDNNNMSLFVENDEINYYKVSQYHCLHLPAMSTIINKEIEILPPPDLHIEDANMYVYGTFIEFVDFLKKEFMCDNLCIAILAYPIHCTYNRLVENRIALKNIKNKNITLALCPTINDILTYRTLNDIFKN